jgi:N-acetylglucosamine-6-phosphate deacetylase
MKNTMKKSTLSRIALLATLICVTGITYGAENETSMKDFGTFVYEMDKNFANFFSQNNKTTFNTYIITLEKLFNDFKRKAEVAITRGNNDALAKEINDLVDYAIRQFTVAYNIMKKYNGKSSNEAMAFGAEIERDFNTEKIFAEIIVKLKVLKDKADKANECTLVKKIESIIMMIDKKRKEWSAKQRLALLTGLTYRMNCK